MRFVRDFFDSICLHWIIFVICSHNNTHLRNTRTRGDRYLWSNIYSFFFNSFLRLSSTWYACRPITCRVVQHKDWKNLWSRLICWKKWLPIFLERIQRKRTSCASCNFLFYDKLWNDFKFSHVSIIDKCVTIAI